MQVKSQCTMNLPSPLVKADNESVGKAMMVRGTVFLLSRLFDSLWLKKKRENRVLTAKEEVRISAVESLEKQEGMQNGTEITSQKWVSRGQV